MSDTAPPVAGRTRDLRLDVLKAVAISLVVFGHVIRLVYGDATKAPCVLASAFSLLALLDVPLFAFVSGYLAKARPGREWVARRALQLLVPYYAWSMIRWLVYYRTDLPGWLYRITVWTNGTLAVWFLWALFVVCLVYAAAARWRWLPVAIAAACLLVPQSAVPWFSARYVLFLFPVFVAGRLMGERRLEPGIWILPVTALLVAAMWSGAGENLIFATPGWAYAVFGRGELAPVRDVAVAVLRMALALGLIGSAFHIARRARRGAWLGALTLGIYCSHMLFMPSWAVGKGLWGIATAYVLVMLASVGTTLVLQRSRWASFALLGSGVPPWSASGPPG